MPRIGGEYLKGQAHYIGHEENGEIIAVVGYDNYNGATIAMHVAGINKRWATREFLRFVFYYPFEQLDVNKVLGFVSSNNQEALKFDRHIGFVDEAIIKDGAPDGDLHILTMTRKQCRLLDVGQP
jgi:RimJ/RimL family protein N-acetyltransferase